MKKQLLLLLILSGFCCNLLAQFNIGLRDSKYANISYLLKDRYSIGVEHSIFSAKIGTQYLRGIFSYCHPIAANTFVKGEIYYGTPYNRTFYNLGTKISAKTPIAGPVSIYATINPHYDSYFHYETFYKVGASCRLNSEIDFLAFYSTIPEYRQKEERLNAGLNFHIRNLMVNPYLSLPLEGPIKSIRVLIGFNYTFKSKRGL